MQNQPISRRDAINSTSMEIDSAVNEIVGIINLKLKNFVEGNHVAVEMGRFETSLSTEAWAKVKTRVIALYTPMGWNISYNSGSQHHDCSQFDIT